MAKLEITVSAERFGELPEELKTYYTQNQDGAFELEGVGSIQRALEAEKAKKATKPELLDEIEKLRQFKADHEAKLNEADEEQKRKAGDFEALEKKLRDRIAEVETSAQAEKSGMLNNLKTERLKNLLVEKGVLPDRAEYALTTLNDRFELQNSETGFSLKIKDGIGDPKEIDAAIDGLKAKAGFLFAATGTSGSGASGSNGNGGTFAKTMPKSQWDGLSVKDQAAFIKDGGRPVD